MKILSTITAVLLMGYIIPLSATNGTVHLYFNGKFIQAKQLEKGAINYYFSLQEEERLVQNGPNSFLHQEKIQVERYFIGNNDELEEINAANFKELIRKYMPNAPELHKRLGKLGFRFENIRYMIQFYNKFRA